MRFFSSIRAHTELVKHEDSFEELTDDIKAFTKFHLKDTDVLSTKIELGTSLINITDLIKSLDDTINVTSISMNHMSDQFGLTDILNHPLAGNNRINDSLSFSDVLIPISSTIITE